MTFWASVASRRSSLGIEGVGGDENPAGVDEDVDAVVGLEGCRDEVGHRQLLAEVAGEGLEPPLVAHPADLVATSRVEAGLVLVGADDGGAGADQSLGDGEADAARRSGDDHRPSREVTRHRRLA